MKNKILILANSDIGLYNFRKELILELNKQGYEIYVSVPFGDRKNDIEALGCKISDINIERRGKNPFKDFKLIKEYLKLIKEIKPDIVLTYTIKPNIYGGIACRLKKIPYIANITGLGSGFNNNNLLKKFLIMLFKISLKKCNCVYFQNKKNMDDILNHKIIKNYYELIPGSGVNLNDFELSKYPDESNGIYFNFIGRIMKDKGIDEYLNAAKNIKLRHNEVFFDIFGMIEDTEKSYYDIIQELEKNNIVKYYGNLKRNEMVKYIKNSHCTILPSYSEGLSNALLETEALGRPVMASNIPGCVETINDGVNGFIFNVKDNDDLINKIEKFLSLSKEQRALMGIKSREKVEKEFNREIIIKSYSKEIKSILNKNT